MGTQGWTTSRRAELLEEIPSGIAVIDPELKIIDHNRAFTELFGTGEGRSCFEVWAGRSARCPVCPAERIFQGTGRTRSVERTGVDVKGREIHYLVKHFPIRDEGGTAAFVAALFTDLTTAKRLRREYQTLFEKVPCYVAVVNRDLRVVKANEAFRRVFGDPIGDHCHVLLKGQTVPCLECPAARTFEDGGSYTSQHMGITRDGRPAPYLVSTAPLIAADGQVSHVIEMALDLTEIHHLKEELSDAHVLREVLVENSLDAIVILDKEGRLALMNRAAEELLGASREKVLGRKPPRRVVPPGLRPVLAGKKDKRLLHETTITDARGEEIPVRAAAVALITEGERKGTAFIAQDLRDIKRLEREKLEAERWAAVGQTVAGLAHGIKNILTAIEGGMYVTSSGLERGDESRVRKGWGMLERNISRISILARNLLAFSRGDRCKPRLTELADVVREAVELFRERAEDQGIELKAEIETPVPPASVDPEGLHACLSNLLSNAIDACLVSSKPESSVKVLLRETNEGIVMEVVDNGCGMEYEVMQKAFTCFFSTKGSGGTGIGLLLTRKIVQEHGGRIDLDSKPGEGTVFTLTFPRDRLPQPVEEKEEK